MMKATEVRKMSAAELEAKLLDLKKDLFQLRLQHATAQLEKTASIPAAKKDIARILTAINAESGKTK